MFAQESFNTFNHVNDFALLVGKEGIKNISNSREALNTWYGKLISNAVAYANQRKIVVQSVNDVNQEFEEVIYLSCTEDGVTFEYYHTMIGNKSMSELLEHDFTLFTKMMNIASNEYQTRYKNLRNLQL